MKLRNLALAALVLISVRAQAADLLKDFDTLGGNDVLLEKAKALNPESQIRVVQDRVVSRRNRFEIAPEFGSVLGGDAYTSTQNLGLNAHFHISPRWSVGVKYAYAVNHLRTEGEYLIGKAQEMGSDGKPLIPDLDYAKSETLAMLNWYPIYGKMNLYDLGVVHFDIYGLLGGGQVELKSGSKPTYTAGGGVGLWWSQHLTTRLELRYQNYKATRYTGETQMNLTVAALQIGYLL